MGERKKSGGDKEGKEAKLDGELECALGEQLELEREAIPIIRPWEKEDKITQPCLLLASPAAKQQPSPWLSSSYLRLPLRSRLTVGCCVGCSTP